MNRHSFDLHVHAWYSYDARLAPEQIFAAAAKGGVNVLAITDHHNMDGLADYARTAGDFPTVRWIRGMEITVSTDWGFSDVVALGTPHDAPRRLADVVDTYRRWMRDLNQRLLAGFQIIGVPFGPDQARHMDRTWRPGPAPAVQGEVRLANVALADWLHEHGLIQRPQEFGDLVNRALVVAGGRPPIPRHEDVLPRFKAVGAVLVLAHPGGLLARVGDKAFARFLAEGGFDGIEAGHTSHTREQAARYLDFARRHDLYVSGGSDIHFTPDLGRIGRHLCEERWVRPLLERLGI